MHSKNLLVALLCLCLCILCLDSFPDADTDQIQNADWFEREIVNGVYYKYYHFTNLFGGPLDVFVTEADLNNPGIALDFAYSPSDWKTISTYAGMTPNAVSVINGNYFDVNTRECVQYFKVDNVVLFTTQPAVADEGGLAVTAENQVDILPRPAAGWDSLTQPSVMASNTMVVHDDAIWPWPHTPSTIENFYYRDKHPRTCLGITDDNKLIMVAVDGRSSVSQGVTYEQLGKIMLGLGCDDAVGLDGGGSTTMWVENEPGSGVVNTPSDGSERRVGNALVVVSANPAPTPQPLDARFISATDPGTIIEGNTKSVTIVLENYGSSTWIKDSIFLATSESEGRNSAFFTEGQWVSENRACSMNEASVAPGEKGTFEFTLTAPTVGTATIFSEAFALCDDSGVLFGPKQNYLYITVVPVSAEGEIIIESRSGGKNLSWYSEAGGWADSGLTSTAPGATPDIGSRYASTYRSIVGAKSAFYTPYITSAGLYDIFVSWPGGGNSQNPITYNVIVNSVEVDHTLIDQTSNGNTWYHLGSYDLSEGQNASVEMCNDDIDASGSMYAGPVKFVLLSNVGPTNWMMY